MTPTATTSSQAVLSQIDEWLAAKEGAHFEFKEAKNSFEFDELAKYCVALANEGGGRVILGVTDKRPRKIVGTGAFEQPEQVLRALLTKIPLRIEFDDVLHPSGRVLIFDVPCRPVATPMKFKGIYWARKGDILEPLGEDRLRAIFSEGGRDFSAEVSEGAVLSDLDASAIDNYRKRWFEKTENVALTGLTAEQLLRDAELVVDGGITNAALVLFGTRSALGRLLAQSEVVFEYRSAEAAGPAQARSEYRQGFFSFYDDLWATINLRNDVQHYRDGLFVRDIPTFDERTVREAVLNAISHRDYQLGGSVFVRQYARRLVIESPGGFPVGVTIDNILDRQSPRNRRIADAFSHCGLVERAGQGVNLMFEQSLRQGKTRPNFEGSDAYQVVLTLDGEVQDPLFIRLFERMGADSGLSLGTRDLLLLDLVHRAEPVPSELKPRLFALRERGILESVGRGRGVRYFLGRRFYEERGAPGAYTRHRGLDRSANRSLLLKHIQENARSGTTLEELQQVLIALSKNQIQSLVRELKHEGRVAVMGKTRGARWFPKE